jgi:hypothetical protein
VTRSVSFFDQKIRKVANEFVTTGFNETFFPTPEKTTRVKISGKEKSIWDDIKK